MSRSGFTMVVLKAAGKIPDCKELLKIVIVSSERRKKLDLKSLDGIGSIEHVDDFISVIAR